MARRRRQEPHNLEFLLLSAQITAYLWPTVRNRRQLRLARQRFAERTTGSSDLRKWITK